MMLEALVTGGSDFCSQSASRARALVVGEEGIHRDRSAG
jgi:hypothetical protein